jgi:probable HAF family extracellular repeat protein
VGSRPILSGYGQQPPRSLWHKRREKRRRANAGPQASAIRRAWPGAGRPEGAIVKILSVGVLGAALLAGTISAPGLAAQRAAQVTYRVADLKSLGGTSSAGSSINDRGWITGYSSLAGNNSIHAALWRNGKVTDLGTLGGPNSAVLWPVKNDGGIITGISQTSQPDKRRGTPWSCAVFLPAATATGHRCVGFEWRDGTMRALPTLGGPNGFATGSNDRGQVAGWAETKAHDPTCDSSHMLRFLAVLWGPGGRVRVLPPLPGDTVSAATALNDRGQVVGISGYCDQAVGRFSAIHAVLWQHGRPVSIGTLGGVAWNTPMAINEHGEVVGFSNVSAAAGGNFDAQAFSWAPGRGIRKLGVLPGDNTSEALGINNRGEVVGISCNAKGACQAFLYRNGTMRNLNKLVGSGDPGTLISAGDINDSGVITGQAETASGALVAFVASPRQ